MKISVIAVGRVRGLLQDAVAEFETRAGRYWKLHLVEVDGGVGRRGTASAEAVRAAEGLRIIDRLPERAEVWCLTREGTALSSARLARTLGRLALEGSAGVTFVLGGAYGLDREVFDRAPRRMSLSRMTLPHEMARLVLAEQLYRAGTILRNEPYHKGET